MKCTNFSGVSTTQQHDTPFWFLIENLECSQELENLWTNKDSAFFHTFKVHLCYHFKNSGSNDQCIASAISLLKASFDNNAENVHNDCLENGCSLIVHGTNDH